MGIAAHGPEALQAAMAVAFGNDRPCCVNAGSRSREQQANTRSRPSCTVDYPAPVLVRVGAEGGERILKEDFG